MENNLINDLLFFDNSIVGRYRTLERNIKSKSNSFFDSYLDLLENTIKGIVDLENVQYDEKYTCGTLLRESNIVDLFKNKIKVDDYTYTKCKDYIAKVNKHKHFSEHTISIDIVIVYLKVYYNVVSTYLSYKGKEPTPFDADYFNKIYGQTIRENKELKLEVDRLKEDLETLSNENKLSEDDNAIYKSLVSAKELENLSLEEQNTELRNQVSKLKDIKLNSLEVKLNKALELLYNLSDSVVESRAIGIAVGKTIIGKDITETDYMKDAVNIVKKKDSVFNKLDRQGKNIEELSSKFSEMDIEKLYESARNAYKVKNHEAAKKYYEQLCSLRPLDWEPAFYVSVCKFVGTFDHQYYWTMVIYSLKDLVMNALNAIKEQDYNDDERNESLKRVLHVACRDFEGLNSNYESLLENKYLTKKYGDKIFFIQEYIGEVIDYLELYKGLECYEKAMELSTKEFARSIKLAKGKCKSTITEEQFNRYKGDNDCKYKKSVDDKYED